MKKQAPKKNGKTRTHVVESGESLWGIAKKYGVSVSDICEASKISPEDPLQPGQELTIPPG